MNLNKRLFAEFIGTFWLVLAGTGSAVLAAGFPTVGIGFLGVSLAFGLALMTMAYAIGRISGCHINPAVTIGLATARRFPWKEVIPYIIAQVIGAIVASGVVYLIARGQTGFSVLASGLASNGYGDHSPGKYPLISAILAETIFPFLFVLVILKVTEPDVPAGFAPIAIGLMLALILLVTIPVTNASINPARSTGPAVYVGDWALSQLWVFWVFPILGGILAGLVYPVLREDRKASK